MVSRSHTYAEERAGVQDLFFSCPIALPILHSFPTRRSSDLTANIAEEEAIVSAQGGFVIVGVEGQPITNTTVANPSAVACESQSVCSATINWSDGTSSTGTITGQDQNGNFAVKGSHTYREEG